MELAYPILQSHLPCASGVAALALPHLLPFPCSLKAYHAPWAFSDVSYLH